MHVSFCYEIIVFTDTFYSLTLCLLFKTFNKRFFSLSCILRVCVCVCSLFILHFAHFSVKQQKKKNGIKMGNGK